MTVVETSKPKLGLSMKGSIAHRNSPISRDRGVLECQWQQVPVDSANFDQIDGMPWYLSLSHRHQHDVPPRVRHALNEPFKLPK